MQSDHQQDRRSKDVDRLLKIWGRGRAPGVAVMVIRDGQVLHLKSYGRADGRAPIRPETSFELASVSKQFTAMALMLLRERGKLDYERTLAEIFPEFVSPDAGKIKLVHLLNHTAGLLEYEDCFLETQRIERNYPRSARTERAEFEPTSSDVLDLFAKRERLFPSRDFEPGVKFEYSNTGYALLSKVVERISGQSYPEFMRQQIFEPLSMRRTFIFNKLSGDAPERATSYDRGWSEYHDIDYTPLNFIYGDGNVRSTLEDLSRWSRALEPLFDPAQSQGAKTLIRPETFAEAKATAVQSDTSNTSYFFGWFQGRARGLDFYWHSGGWVGFRTMIMRFPQQRLTVLLLSNVMQFPPSAMACGIASIYLKDEMAPFPDKKLSPELLRPFVKRYQPDEQLNPFEDYVDITLEPDSPRSKKRSLWLKTPNLEKFRLVPEFDASGNFNGEFFRKGMEGFDIFRFAFKGVVPGRFMLVPPPRPRKPIHKRELFSQQGTMGKAQT